ncbi:biogenesis of lysosome-related organelles complex 1 subunit 6 isoform X2 [Procambarus clarkii]
MDRDPPKDESDCNGLCGDRMEAVEEQSQVPPSLAAIMSTIYAHQHNIQQIEVKLKELLQNQQVLTEGLRGENERFKEAETTFNLPALFSEVCVYTQKLAYLREEMNNITDRTARLKRRAMRLQQQQQQKALNQEQQRAQLAEREKHLIARPVWAPQQDGK